jgi:hypothetical protein
MDAESDDAFLTEFIGRLQWMSQRPKLLSTSRGSIPMNNEEGHRLNEIAKRRGKIASQMIEELLQ